MRTKVLFLDGDLLAVDKPAGLSLATPERDPGAAVRNLWETLGPKERAAAGSPEGWTLLHRLDVTTTGVLLLARSGEAHRSLVALWRAGAFRKRYLAIAWGRLQPPSGSFASPLGPDRDDRRKMRVDTAGKRALTLYRTLSASPVATFAEATLETGRTHQVRVHFAAAGHPLLGDDLYGALRDIPEGVSPADRRALHAERALLHAWCVEASGHPSLSSLSVTAPLPADFAGVLKRLGFAAP